MKTHKILMLLAALTFNSCGDELPSYSDLHPQTPPQEKPKEEEKDEPAPGTPALGYTVTYAVGNTLLILWGVILTLMVA